MDAGRLACFVLGHRYTPERVHAEDEAQHSRCTRCGHKRYKPPGDAGFDAGAYGAGATGGGF